MDGIVSFPPPLKENAYQRLLYAQLARHGIPMPDVGHFKVGWMLGHRRDVRFLHFHWPQDYYRHPPRPKGPWSWLKLALFAVRLAAARVLGYRIAWTVHEVFPLQTASHRLDVLGGRLLARAAHLLITNDEPTAASAAAELGARREKIAVVPHPSYVGAYPEGRSREAVRAELGLPVDAPVFLLFGHLTVYKSIEWLLDAFRASDCQEARLLVAGLVMDESVGAAVERAAADDPRVIARLGFIPDEAVAELFGAADVAVCPRRDGGTSGVLVLAMSQGVPALAASVPAYTAITGGARAAWRFSADDPASATDAFERAARREDAAAKASAAREQVDGISWESMGRHVADRLYATLPAGRPATAAAAPATS
jgi:glycosyltransferase involved in cell wall biosynthesis